MLKKLEGKTIKIIIAVILVAIVVVSSIIAVKESYATEEERVTSETASRLLTGETADQYVPELRSQASVTANKISISAREVNEVELTATLITSSEEYCKLYKNPVLTFSVPENTTITEIGQAVVSGGTELSVLGTYLDNNKVIVALQGEQTTYTQTSINTQVKVPVKIAVDRMIANRVDQISMNVENQNDTVARVYTTAINVNSLEGLVLYTGIANYGDNLVEFYGNQENNYIKLNMDTEAKTITVTGKILNNYSEDLSNLKVTLNPQWTHANGQKETATFRLGDLANGSFVYDQLGVGQVISFSATIDIPANLYFNETLDIAYSIEYTHIGLIYNSDMSVKMQTEQKDFVGAINYLTVPNTDNKVRVETLAQKGNTMLNENDNVYEGETVKYTITLTNLTVDVINNLKTKMTKNNDNTLFYDTKDAGEDISGRPLKEYAELTETELIKSIEVIENKKMATVSFEVVAQKDTQSRIIANALEFYIGDASIGSINTINNNIIDGELKVSLKNGFALWQNDLDNAGIKLENDLELNYILNIENLTNASLSNVAVKIDFPSYVTNVTFHDEELQSQYQNGQFTFNISQIENLYTQTIDITVGNFEGKQVVLDIFAVATVNNNNYISNKVSKTFLDAKTDIKITAESNISNDVLIKENDELNYTIKLKNNGIENIEVDIYDIVPFALELKGLTLNNESVQNYTFENNELNYTLVLIPGEEKEVKILTKVIDEMNVINEIYVTAANDDYVFSFSNDIEQVEEDLEPINDEILIDDEGNNPGGETNVDGTYSIKGKVWLDANKNGKRDDIENIVSGVETYLVDAQNQNNFVKDAQGNILKLTTNENGEYEFNNVAKGTYFVLFEYDTNTYELTTYQAKEAEESLNSDGKDYTLKINNVDTNVAITGAVVIDSTNIYNIDLGLKLLPKFDLKLDKYITKTVVQNDSGTKTETYIDKNTVKVEIPAKYISKSVVIVEYTIRVTNQGDLAGYVSTIVDKLPEGLKFSSDYNKDWYLGTDGNLYNASLANTKIEAGQSKDITLTLTKSKTDNDANTILNNAEITKTVNERNLQEADLVNNSNDATLIISIKTGEILMISVLVIICVSIVGLGIFEIKKRIIK